MTTRAAVKIKKGGQNLNRYAGEWVAFVDRKVFLHHNDLHSLMREVKKKKLEKKASVFLVPHKDEGPYILKIL